MDTRKELLVDLLSRFESIVKLLEEHPLKPDPADKIYRLVSDAIDICEEEIDISV